jgi:hypothetical protein
MNIPYEKIQHRNYTTYPDKYKEPLTEYQKSDHPEKDIIERIRYLAVDSPFTEEDCIFLYKVINQDTYAIAKQYALEHIPKWFEIALPLIPYLNLPMCISSHNVGDNVYSPSIKEVNRTGIALNKTGYYIFYYLKDKDFYIMPDETFLYIERVESYIKKSITYSHSVIYLGGEIYKTAPISVDTLTSYMESFTLNLTLKDVLLAMKA